MTSTPNRAIGPVRGEVWLVNFDPSVGDEQQKIRPAVVGTCPMLGVSNSG
jgi:hypothetical protein